MEMWDDDTLRYEFVETGMICADQKNEPFMMRLM